MPATALALLVLATNFGGGLAHGVINLVGQELDQRGT